MTAEFSEELRGLWTALRHLLHEFGLIQDRLDPARLGEFRNRLELAASPLRAQLQSPGPTLRDQDQAAYAALSRSATQALQGAARFAAAGDGQRGLLQAFQSLRSVARSQEILYALAGVSSEVSRFFLTPELSDDAELLDALRRSAGAAAEDFGGVHAVDHERGKRGGYSVYVPEYYVASRDWPLIVALHGGSGHGADFLWSWLREARTFGCILAAPSSQDRTWSLHRPGVDAAALNAMLASISERWNIRSQRILLTGISDGGTYAMLLATAKQSPFTHYAPVAAAVHALLGRDGEAAVPLRGCKVYDVHGARDWMFPVEHARLAAEALQRAGAELVYKEIEDLSHNYPRDANTGIVRWFLDRG
ncbi:MAG: hypothetical protein K1X75_08715 [Leptospirales bacterium]|nr:hypothetical protein [Leptospirales bacterium]